MRSRIKNENLEDMSYQEQDDVDIAQCRKQL